MKELKEDEQPLTDRRSKSKPLSTTCLALIVVTIFLIALLILALFLRFRDPGCPEPVPPSTITISDFPLFPHQPWDIKQNHPRNLKFTTSEGTWISLSYSSNSLIMDLLGDIYTLPLSGNKAVSLIRGVQFDVQPHFSQDGKFITFSSDMSGCDNIWVYDVSTGKKFQVTNESFHFVNNPKWSPDGKKIVAVKWFTSTRSIGAGEIWEFDVDFDTNIPSSGRQLVPRDSPNSQVGPEEPIYSYDGSLVYYSKNTQDGSTFDLETGNQLQVFNGLDFDQQESSALSGVYPSFCWSNETHVYIWGKGLIYLVNTVDGSSSVVPFTLDVNLDLAATVRSKHNPSSLKDDHTLDVKTIAFPSLSSSSNYGIFSAVGFTILKDIPANTTTIVSDGASYSFSPSISESESFFVHSTWSDASYGSIQICQLRSPTTCTTVTNSPGRYISPKLSPDSKILVWQKLGGTSMSGSTYSTNPGIYYCELNITDTLEVTVGEIIHVANYGVSSFSFSRENHKRIYALRGSYSASYSEIDLESGKVVRELATSKYGTEIVISPDEEYIAFIEFRSVYVTKFSYSADNGPMELTSRFVNDPEVEPYTEAITPNLFHCSLSTTKIGGQFISWSDDSKLIRWSTGATLYQVNVPEYYKCEDCDITVEEFPFSFPIPSSRPVNNTPIVFDNVTVVTMDDAQSVIQNAKIVVIGNKISDFGARDSVVTPVGSVVYDLTGKTVTPGFIDAHAHWNGWDNDYFSVQQSWEFLLNLAYGVTTVHNPSSDTVTTFLDKELIEAGRKIGPRITTTGTIIYGAGGPYHCEVGSVDDALVYLQQLQAHGGFSLKSYNQPSRSSRQQILTAATQLQMNVVPEGGMAFFWNVNQIIDGHTTIEHSLPVAPLYNDVITLFAQSGTAYTPTLIVNYGGLWGEEFFYERTNVWEEEKFLKFAPVGWIRGRSMRRTKAAGDLDYHQFATSESVKKILDAGGLIQAGAHGQIQGLGFFWEMQLMSQGNISNLDVLKIATRNGAVALGMDDFVGSIQVGKFADLLIFDDSLSPLVDIKNADKNRNGHERWDPV